MRVLVAIFAVTLASAVPVRAQTVVVAPLDGLGVEPALLTQLATAVHTKANELGMSLVDPDQVAREAACAGDVACLTALGKKFQAQTVVAGSVGLVGDQLNIALKLVDVASAKETRNEVLRAPLDQAEPRMRATALKLLNPQRYNTSGALIVRVDVAGAEVIVDGATRGTTPLLGPIDALPPGRREVEVRAPGIAEPWRGFVDTPVEGVAKVELKVIDGKLVDAALAGTGPVAPAGPSPLLWAGGGALAVGVTATIVGAIVGMNAINLLGEIERGDFTQAKIDQQQASATTANVLVPLGIAALGGGAVLVGVALME